jgi:hypothetical protein
MRGCQTQHSAFGSSGFFFPERIGFDGIAIAHPLVRSDRRIEAGLVLDFGIEFCTKQHDV